MMKNKAVFTAGCIILAAVSISVYLNTLGNPFVWDDVTHYSREYIIRNPVNAGKMFRSDWYKYNTEIRYRPVAVATHFLYYAAAGNNTAGVRFMNLVLHAACVLLVFITAGKVFGDCRAAFLSAALFAVHPLNTEVNNIITLNDDVLVTVLLLAAVLVHLSKMKEPFRAAAEAAVFTAAVFTKETAVMIPAALILYDASNGRKSGYARYLVYLVLIPLYFAVRFRLTVHPMELIRKPIGLDMPGNLRLLAGAGVLYLKRFILPLRMSLFNDLGSGAGAAGITVSAAAAAAWIYGAFLSFRKNRKLFFFLAAAAMFSAPAAYPVLETGLANERFMYTPLACMFIIAVPGLTYIKGKLPGRHILPLCCGVLVMYFSVFTLLRNREYRDPVLLWEKEAGRNPEYWMAWTELGEAYRVHRHDYSECLMCHRKANDLKPGMVPVLRNLAKAYIDLGRSGEAEKILAWMIKEMPFPRKAYFLMGTLHEKKREYKKAIEMFGKAAELFPAYGEAYLKKAGLCEITGNTGGAVETYRKYLRYDPGNTQIKRRIVEINEKVNRQE